MIEGRLTDDLKQYMRQSCAMRGSVLSSNLLLVRELHQQIETVISEKRDRTRQAVQDAYSNISISPNERLSRELDLASAYAYPMVARGALFAIAYGTAEFELDALCRDGTPAIPNAVALDGMPGRPIEKIKRYLRSVVGIEWGAIKEWRSFKGYGSLRNTVVHSRGFIHDANQERRIRAFMRSCSSFEIIEVTKRVWLKESFVPEFCDSVGILWNQLQSAWHTRWS